MVVVEWDDRHQLRASILDKVIESKYQIGNRQLAAQQEVRLEADGNLSPHTPTNLNVPRMFRCKALLH